MQQPAVAAKAQQLQSTGTCTSGLIRSARAVIIALMPSCVDEQLWCSAIEATGVVTGTCSITFSWMNSTASTKRNAA